MGRPSVSLSGLQNRGFESACLTDVSKQARLHCLALAAVHKALKDSAKVLAVSGAPAYEASVRHALIRSLLGFANKIAIAGIRWLAHRRLRG